MKKIAVIAVTIAAAVPSLLFGIDTTERMNQDRRDVMLRERFISYCQVNGVDYYALTNSEREVYYLDVWAETDDYQEAQDSIDRVLSDRVKNYILND